MKGKGMLIIGLLIMPVVLVSCGMSKDKIYHPFHSLTDNSGTRAEERAEAIMTALNTRDKEMIRDMFAKAALEEIADFDEELEGFFHYLPGEIKGWDEDYGGGPYSQKKSDYGHIKEFLIAEYHTSINGKQYAILFKDIMRDTDNRDNLGLSYLQIKEFEGDMLCSVYGLEEWELSPGVYYPE